MDYGIVVDVETTGLNAEKDRIIEIGLVNFQMGKDFPPTITDMYSGLEDPGQPLSDEIVELTGISDELLTGKKIDWELVRCYFERASIVIAHNCEFDAGFLRRRPELAGIDVHWACSVAHIKWRELGFKTRSLNYLAADHGFVNPFAHRALFDCATTFRVIAPYMEELIERSYEREFMLQAVGAPFETKDLLKNNGYRWDSENRFWQKRVFESELELERAWLQDHVYQKRKGAAREVELIPLDSRQV